MAVKWPQGGEVAAWVEGLPASLDEAAEAAARLLSQSVQPLIAGLGADIDGARAALALAERVGGVIEHMHSGALMRDLDCLRETGVMLTTPGEARVRADVLLLVGDALWDRFRLTPDEQLWYYRSMTDVLSQRLGGPVVSALASLVAELAGVLGPQDAKAEVVKAVAQEVR